MKVNVDKTLYQINGEPLKDENGELITLKKIMCLALLSSQQNLDGLEKFKRGKLASKIWEAEKDIDLTLDDLVLIKRLVGENFGVYVVYQVWDYLENLEKENKNG